jgi:hypothetical protein
MRALRRWVGRRRKGVKISYENAAIFEDLTSILLDFSAPPSQIIGIGYLVNVVRSQTGGTDRHGAFFVATTKPKVRIE